ncbi:MAG: ATP-binding cassette domain-containing protein [Limnohabitans sp.]|nr:ATP-binding cassette domain-containing protein [Limnohabitans sp.]
MLTIENLSVSLAGSPVLRALSLTVHAGTTTAVVGRNGAGKTTLLRSIMGLVTPSSGTIHLDEENLTQAPAYGRTGVGIGYAPEDRVIFPTLSVQENLRLPCEVLGLSEADMQERLSHVLEVVPQLKPMLARSGAALSGGQGKMVALGRALMVGKTLVLLDEPFQGLAPALAQQYAEALARLRQSRPDLAVIITESNAALLTDIPNQILTIERGSFVEASTH